MPESAAAAAVGTVTGQERNWQGPGEGCCWAWCYPDGIAVYHSLTGSTHVLPEVAWQVLAALVQGCGNPSALHLHLLSRGWHLAREELDGTLLALQAARLANPQYRATC